METESATLQANSPQNLFTASVTTGVYKIRSTQGDAILKITIGSKTPQYLSISGWQQQPYFIIGAGEAFVIESNVATTINYFKI